MAERPTDDENTLHIETDYAALPLEQIMDLARAKWPDILPDQISLEGTRVQTSGCRCHPSGDDYTGFLIIRRIST